MAEGGIRSETYRAGTSIRLGSITLLPVERSVMHVARTGPGLWCWCDKAPHALLVRDAGGVRAVGSDAAPVDVARLRALLPDLDALLAAL